MSLRTLSQVSFFDPEFVLPGCLEPGTLPWLLARHRSRVLPAWLFRGWRGQGPQGRKAWPAPVLMTLALLRWSQEGMSRLASARTARTDVVWRAAMGLQFGAPTPTEKTMREFEKFLRGRHPDADRPRYLVVHQHFVQLCTKQGLGDASAVWGTDSTPMWCYGAVLDTVRLLGDGVRKLARYWAQAQGVGVRGVAERWGATKLLTAKSAKGGIAVDWHDRDARATALDLLARLVIKAVREVRRHVEDVQGTKRKQLLALCRRLLTVVAQNLKEDEQGRLVVAHKVAPGRLTSLTDPQARHGRKTASRLYTGFKVHVLGDCVSGLIASLTVTHGSQHDSTVTPRLVHRAKALLEGFNTLLADTAYGGAQLRHKLAHTQDVAVLAPPPVGGHPENRLSKQDFAIDFQTMTATCPNHAPTTTTVARWSKVYDRSTPEFHWRRDDCDPCPLRERCLAKGLRHKRLKLHAYEVELRKAREDWKDPAVRKAYKQRGQHERLINRVVRHGARKARAWGLASANLQVHTITMAANLVLLARQLAKLEDRTPLTLAA